VQRNRQGEGRMKVRSEYMDSDGSLKEDFVGGEGDSIGVSELEGGEGGENWAGRGRSSVELKESSPKKCQK
jgi:hypothetical protein